MLWRNKDVYKTDRAAGPTALHTRLKLT